MSTAWQVDSLPSEPAGKPEVIQGGEQTLSLDQERPNSCPTRRIPRGVTLGKLLQISEPTFSYLLTYMKPIILGLVLL